MNPKIALILQAVVIWLVIAIPTLWMVRRIEKKSSKQVNGRRAF
jgi:biopolymer transport protein ExbB/TolQ